MLCVKSKCAKDAPYVRGSAGRAWLVRAWHLAAISAFHIHFTVWFLSENLLET